MKNDAETQGADAIASKDLLGKDGFVFLDERPWPYAVKKHVDVWWLYYWSDSKKSFSTMRPLSDDDVALFRPRALSPERAALYLPNDQAHPQPGAAVVERKGKHE